MNAPSGPFAMRLTALRQELSKRGLDGFLVPRVDEHQGEYVPARAQRLTWLTGFDGSAGVAAVLADQAAIFVDGRYTVQVRQQVDGALFTYKHLTEEPPETWLAKELKAGQRLGVDPWLMSLAQKRRLEAALAPAKIELVLLDSNPLDQVWLDQPAAPQAPVKPHAPEFAGESSATKRQRIGKAIAEKAADLAMLTLPDSICWLINVRGSDVERTPFALSFALIGSDGGLTWFIDPAKLTAQVKVELDPAVKILPPSELSGALASLKGKRVLVDAGTVPVWVVSRLTAAGAIVVEGVDPCQLPKAKKNPVEIQGMRQAHRRDGVAVSRLLSWFEREVEKGGLTESAVADRLEAFRREDNLLQDLSFDTIAGTGPNGSVVHYRVTPASNRPIAKGDVMVLDSGGQYLDGTTDITRTLVAGQPSAEARDRHTRVLKGHIALATARFPKGTTGHQLDVLARLPLWQAGLDYDHGTGHGVGAYLSVHEGPQNISKRAVPVPLEAGMIVSNEPGYYKNGAYGMRVENLVLVVESPKAAGEEREMLAFETLTLAPIERKLIDKSLLSAEEIAWVDAYHALVEAEVGPKLSGGDRAWLAEACRPL